MGFPLFELQIKTGIGNTSRVQQLRCLSPLLVAIVFYFPLSYADEHPEQAVATARALYEEGLNDKAIHAALKAIQSGNNDHITREAHRIIGQAYTKMAKYDAALKALELAQQLARQAKSDRGEGLALIYKGDVYERRKDHPQAMAHYSQALVLLERIKAWPEARRAWLQIGDIEVAHANYDEGLKAYQQALTFARNANDPSAVTENLDYIGYAYRKLGDVDRALHFHRDAIAQAKHIGSTTLRQKSLARSHNHLGLSLRGSAINARRQGKRTTALSLLKMASDAEKSALEAALVVNDRVREGYVLRAASLIERELAELHIARHALQEKALHASLEYGKQAIYLAREINNPEWEGLALHTIGIAQARLGNTAEAESSFTEAIALWQRIGDQNALGYSHSLYASEIMEPTARTRQAREHYHAAEIAFSTIHAQDELSGIYFRQGNLAERLGESVQARDFYLRSIDTLEGIRSQLSAEESRLVFFGGRQAPYEALIRLLSRTWKESGKRADIELAFKISERARGRTLLDIMSRASLFRYAGLEPGLLAKEQALESALNVATAALRRPHTPSDNAALVVQNTRATNALARFSQALRKSHPAYAYLRNPQPLSATEVRTQALQDGQVLLEYFIGEQESYAFVLSKGGAISLHTLNITRPELLNKIKRIRSPFEDIKATGSMDTLQGFDVRLAQELYAVLFEPVRQSVHGAQELLVVPHGPLFYLPLEMLVSATRTDKRSDVQPGGLTQSVYLIEEAPPIRYALSASLLNPLFNQAGEQSNARVLAFINPAIARAAGTRDFALPAAKHELAGLQKVYGDRLRVYSEQGATKQEFISSSPDFGTLILSAHGTFDETFPQRSGILLAGSLDLENWLRVQDVFGLRLHAGLVSLGVCEVGLGRIQDGEGLLGFTRAWQYAGARKLLVTLWSVEDNATADLSVAFHQRLGTGESAAAALRHAKRDLLGSRFHQGGINYGRDNPFFWAPFVLY